MDGAITLCGSMFGLGAYCRDGLYRQLRRHRLFLSSEPITAPRPCAHSGNPVGVYGNGGGQRGAQHRTPTRKRGYKADSAEGREAMGIDWMRRADLSQAIPPAYTEHIGRQLLKVTTP